MPNLSASVSLCKAAVTAQSGGVTIPPPLLLQPQTVGQEHQGPDLFAPGASLLCSIHFSPTAAPASLHEGPTTPKDSGSTQVMHPGQQPPRATAHSPGFEPSSSSAGWGSSPPSLTCRQASPPRPSPACLHGHAGEGTTEDGRSPFDDGASGRLQPPRIHLPSQKGWRAPGPVPPPRLHRRGTLSNVPLSSEALAKHPITAP